jgi:hypothetical protein
MREGAKALADVLEGRVVHLAQAILPAVDVLDGRLRADVGQASLRAPR